MKMRSGERATTRNTAFSSAIDSFFLLSYSLRYYAKKKKSWDENQKQKLLLKVALAEWMLPTIERNYHLLERNRKNEELSQGTRQHWIKPFSPPFISSYFELLGAPFNSLSSQTFFLFLRLGPNRRPENTSIDISSSLLGGAESVSERGRGRQMDGTRQMSFYMLSYL